MQYFESNSIYWRVTIFVFYLWPPRVRPSVCSGNIPCRLSKRLNVNAWTVMIFYYLHFYGIRRVFIFLWQVFKSGIFCYKYINISYYLITTQLPYHTVGLDCRVNYSDSKMILEASSSSRAVLVYVCFKNTPNKGPNHYTTLVRENLPVW